MLSFPARRLLGAGRRLAARLRRRPAGIHLAQPRQLWSIGIYAGPSPSRLSPLQGSSPVLTWTHVTDVRAEFVADPFMVHASGGWYMFFEVLNRATTRGEIGVATSDDALSWRYEGIVLKEPFHLSYPYVFEVDGIHYMVPETYQANSIRLYRAVRFPHVWVLDRVLLQGQTFLDSSLIRFRNRWWLFAETNPWFKFDTLRLFYSDGLFGPWKEHPKSPIVQNDPRRARPAGRLLALGDRLIRHAQNCTPFYGTSVRAFEVIELSPTAYSEQELSTEPVLGPSRTGWNAWGMHHVDAHPLKEDLWLASVDGWIPAPPSSDQLLRL